MDENKQTIEQLKKDIRRELDEKAKKKGFPVPLTVSIGSVISDPVKCDRLEEYVRLADEQMYKEKVAKKANRK